MSTTILKMPLQTEEHTVTTYNELEPIEPGPQESVYSPEDIASLHHDDAMAAGVIVFILSCAFLVLLCLAFGANIWTSYYAN